MPLIIPPAKKVEKKPGSHMFHLVYRGRELEEEEEEEEVRGRNVKISSYRFPRWYPTERRPHGLVIRFNISRQTKQIRGNKGGPGYGYRACS